jgi:hypothetical protein
MEERKKVADFELRDHGVDHAQYFPGCGTAFTRFDRCYTGCGDSLAEAFSDALEQVAEDGFDARDLEVRILAEENEGATFADIPTAHNDCDPENDDMCELHYYASILITKE